MLNCPQWYQYDNEHYYGNVRAPPGFQRYGTGSKLRNLWFGLKEFTVLLINDSVITQPELEMYGHHMIAGLAKLAGSVLNNMGWMKLFTDIDIAPRIYKINGAPISSSSTNVSRLKTQMVNL